MSINSALENVHHSAIRTFTNLAKQTPGCLSLTLGEPDFDTPKEIEEEVGKAFEAGETHYIANNGSMDLRQKIAQYEQIRHHRPYSADNVIVTAGAEEGLFLSLFTLLDPGDQVIIPTPAFSAYAEIVKLCRAMPVFLDTSQDAFQIDGQKLEDRITDRTKAIILNTPNNPTGCLLDHQSLAAVADVVRKHSLYVIADDVYQQLVYTQDCESIADFDTIRSQTILVQSFSKPYAMTGWRMGYLCVDPDIRYKMELVHQYAVTSTPAPFQRAAERALDFDPSAFVETYRKRRAFMLKRLSEMDLPVPTPLGAFYVFPSIEEFGMSSEEFCMRMIKEGGLAATPGSAFGCDGHIRLTYCYADPVLKEGMDRLQAFIEKVRSEKP